MGGKTYLTKRKDNSMYDKILENAKSLISAIDNSYLGELWDTDLENAHASVCYHGISEQLDELKNAIKKTEKLIYDQDANNHPVWKELRIDPYTYDDFTHLDGSYGDPDGGCEWYKFWWDSYEGIWVEFQIQVTLDNGRDWGSVVIDNWKSEEDTIKWLRDRNVDEDNELSDDFILDEAHGLFEIIPFNDGFLINKEKVYED